MKFTAKMFRFFAFSFIIAFANGLPKDFVDLALMKNGLTNSDIATIVEQTAHNLDGTKIVLENIVDRIINYNLLIDISGELSLMDGYLSNVSSYEVRDKISRSEATNYEIPLRFKYLEFGYHYDAEIGWTTHYGNITAVIHDFDITLPLHFCGSKLNLMKIDPFKYRNIEIRYDSDSILTKLFTTITSIFEEIILHLVEDIYAKYMLKEITGEMNKILADRFSKVM